MQSLRVYGFGSFFNRSIRPNDIDLLLVHRSTDRVSCQFAIDCKTEIRLALPEADVVMLSENEADGLQFLMRSKAVVLGRLHSGDLEAQVRALVNRIRAADFGEPSRPESRRFP